MGRLGHARHTRAQLQQQQSREEQDAEHRDRYPHRACRRRCVGLGAVHRGADVTDAGEVGVPDQFGMDPRRGRSGSETEQGAKPGGGSLWTSCPAVWGGPIVARAAACTHGGRPSCAAAGGARQARSGGGGAVRPVGRLARSACRPGRRRRGGRADGRVNGRTFDSFDACQADASAYRPSRDEGRIDRTRASGRGKFVKATGISSLVVSCSGGWCRRRRTARPAPRRPYRPRCRPLRSWRSRGARGSGDVGVAE